MNLYIDTCVFPRCSLEEAAYYRNRFGPDLGFELLPMFDLPDFEENLKRNLHFLEDGPLIFHEPVWGVEHTAETGTARYEESMHHLRLTRKYAEILHPTHLVYHLNNCAVPEEKKDRMLRTSLENLDKMREMFKEQTILVENTGVEKDGTVMLNQTEFTTLAAEMDLDVLIDVGHANVNGWDLGELLDSLSDRIRGFHLHNNDGQNDLHNRIREGNLDFDRLMSLIRQSVPDAFLVIEYTRPEYHGEQTAKDIVLMKKYTEAE